MRSPCMYMYNCDFFFPFGHISSCSHLCPKHRVGWAQFDRRAHVAGGLGAIRAVCRAWQAFETFLVLGTLKANPRVSATSLGIGLLHPLSPCKDLDANRVFLVHFPYFCTYVSFISVGVDDDISQVSANSFS